MQARSARILALGLFSAYSRNPTTRSAFATRHGCRSAESLEEIVVDSSFTPSALPRRAVRTPKQLYPILEAGKAVLCEKPLEISLEAVDQILSAAERGNGVVAGVFQMRLGQGRADPETGQSTRAAFGRLTFVQRLHKVVA
jgi:predicted dehydrogenase